jgi:hypothetical protein
MIAGGLVTPADPARQFDLLGNGQERSLCDLLQVKLET